MPSFVIPQSGGRPVASPLREFNGCHDPHDGRFCGDTIVGITSARKGKGNRAVFRQMHDMEAALTRLPGVTDVSVAHGVGAWQGGSEPTWIVRYSGNGEATKLFARLGKLHDQDAVLLLKPCAGADCSPVADLHFARPLGKAAMEALAPVLTAAGFGGWTWGKEGGQTLLRLASVPQWGGDAERHLAAVRQLMRDLDAVGLHHALTVRQARPMVLDRSNYDTVIRG